MRAIDYLCGLPHVPMQLKGDMPVKASNSERRRWLESGSVQINGQTPGPNDEIEYPINQLVFFPNGKRRCTML